MEQAEVDMNELRALPELRQVPLSASDVICELAFERREVVRYLDNLKKFIDVNPTTVNKHHKKLLKRQAKAMKEYVDVLNERIEDLLDSDA